MYAHRQRTVLQNKTVRLKAAVSLTTTITAKVSRTAVIRAGLSMVNTITAKLEVAAKAVALQLFPLTAHHHHQVANPPPGSPPLAPMEMHAPPVFRESAPLPPSSSPRNLTGIPALATAALATLGVTGVLPHDIAYSLAGLSGIGTYLTHRLRSRR